MKRIFGLREDSSEQCENKALYSLETQHLHLRQPERMGCCFSTPRLVSKRRDLTGRLADEATSTDRLLDGNARNGGSLQYRSTSSLASEDDLLNEIDEGLDRLIKESTSRCESAIVLPAEVYDLWDSPHIANFYRTQGWYAPEWDKTNRLRDYCIILSILVKIGFRKWNKFRSIFLDKANRTDRNLPFNKNILQAPDFLGSKGRDFYVKQWTFCPLVIKENAEPLELAELDEERRFPFVELEKEIGSGFAGTVYKQVIAKGHLVYQSPGRSSVNDVVSIATPKVRITFILISSPD